MKVLYLCFLILFMICSPDFVHAQDSLQTGRQYIQNHQYTEAIQYFSQKLEQNEDDPLLNFYLGRSYLLSGDHDKAIDYLEKAVEGDESAADYHYVLGQALGVKAQNSGMLKQAWLAPKILNEFEKTVELDSTHIGGLFACANFYLQAPSVMGGDLDKARRNAEKLIRLGVKQGKLLLINIHAKEGRKDLAEQEYEAYDRAFNDSTDSYTFYNSYGYFLLGQKKYDKAIRMFQKQVALAPDRANPYDSLGDAYRAAGRKEEALTSYEKALQIDPNYEPSREKVKKLKKELDMNED